jgi:hypothetical protein
MNLSKSMFVLAFQSASNKIFHHLWSSRVIEPRSKLDRMKLRSLQIVHVGSGTHALALEPEIESSLQQFIQQQTPDKTMIRAISGQDGADRHAAVHSLVATNQELSIRCEELREMRVLIRHNVAVLLSAQRAIACKSHTRFPNVRWEFLISPAGLLTSAFLVALITVIGVMAFADYRIACETVKSSPLFDRLDSDPNQPMVDPPDEFIALFCIVPIGLLTLACKALQHPSENSRGTPKYRVHSKITFTLGLLTSVGFAWIVGGQESLIGDLIFGSKAQTIAGIKVSSSIPPFEYIAIVMLAMGSCAALLLSYVPKLLLPFYQMERSIDLPANARKLSRIDQALAISRRTLGLVQGVLRTSEGIAATNALVTIHAAQDTEKSKLARLERQADQIRRRISGLGCIFLVCSVLLTGCRKSEVEPPKVESSVSPAAVSFEQNTIDVHIFFSEATATNFIRPFIDQWLTSQLPGGSLVHLYEGQNHRHISTIDVPFGPAQARIRNPRFQLQYETLDTYFKSRKAGVSDQIGWPLVAETIASMGPSTRDQTWVLMCGNPLYLSGEDAVFSFANDLVPAHSLIGKRGTPFEIRHTLPPKTLVRWLASTAQWGDNSDHRFEATLFQRVYWHELSGHLTDITPNAATAFSFKSPYTFAASPVRRDDPPMMLRTKPPVELDSPSEQPSPVRIAQGFRRISMAEEGTLQYQIEMAGGQLEDLRGESLVIQCYLDTSGSMEAKLQETVQCVMQIAEDLPPLVRSLEVGITAASDKSHLSFPIQTIRARATDGGRSIQSLRQFLSSVVPESGDYSTTEAIEESTAILEDSGKGKRKFLLFLSDVVCVAGSNEEQQVQKERVLSRVKGWATQSNTDHRVIVLYSGTESQHATFYRDLADTHANGIMSRDPSVLIDQVIAAAMPAAAEAFIANRKQQ